MGDEFSLAHACVQVISAFCETTPECLPSRFALLVRSGSGAFINEFHYDNPGADVGEFVEVLLPPGADVTAYAVVGYNGAHVRDPTSCLVDGSVKVAYLRVLGAWDSQNMHIHHTGTNIRLSGRVCTFEDSCALLRAHLKCRYWHP